MGSDLLTLRMELEMEPRELAGKRVMPIGLGCMGMSEFYGPTDEAQSLEVLSRAMELGVGHFDTADMYGDGHNERLLGRAIRQSRRRDDLLVATKCGIVRDPADPSRRYVDNTPAYIKQACELSLERLGTHIDLYYLHRIARGGADIEASIGAMADLIANGSIKAVGISEANAGIIRRAHAALLERTGGKHGLSAVQTEFSLMTRDIERNGILATCEELGIGIVAYSPISRGLLGGRIGSLADLDQHDFRRTLPRFSAASIDGNAATAAEISRIAESVSATPAQIAIAWVLSRSPRMFAIPGTKRHAYLNENWAAGNVALGASTLERIDEALARHPVRGERYTAEVLKAYGLDQASS